MYTEDKTRAVAALLCVSFLLISGCQTTRPPNNSGQQIDQLRKEHEVRLEEAENAYQTGKDAFEHGHTDEARRYFEKALDLNPYHGGAHNDLGVIYFREGDLFSAASEFDAAASDLVNAYQPFYNLGMVWERAGRLEKAADSYKKALDLAPGKLPVMENLVRTYVKMDSNPKETMKLLRDAILKEQRPEWKEWLRLQLSRLRSGKAAEESETDNISNSSG